LRASDAAFLTTEPSQLYGRWVFDTWLGRIRLLLAGGKIDDMLGELV
jgi:hypothetical protein